MILKKSLILCGFIFTVLSSSSSFAAITVSSSIDKKPIDLGEVTNLRITITNNSNNHVGALTFGSNIIPLLNPLPGDANNGLKIFNDGGSNVPSFSCTTPPSFPDNTVGSIDLSALTDGNKNIYFTGAIPAKNSSTDASCEIIIPIVGISQNGLAQNQTFTIAANSVVGTDGAATVSNADALGLGIQVNAMSKPTISKSFSNSGVAIYEGDNQTLTVTVQNTDSSIALNNFTIADNLPSVVEYVSDGIITCGSGSGGSFNANTTSKINMQGSLAPSEGCSFAVTVKATDPGVLYQSSATNEINKSSVDFVNDSGIEAVQNATASIKSRFPLDVTTDFTTSSIVNGASSTLTITFANSGNSSFTIDKFEEASIDDIPGSDGIIIDSIGSFCTGGGTNGSFIRINGNEGIRQDSINTVVAANSTCTLTLGYTATAPGTNEASTATHTIGAGTDIYKDLLNVDIPNKTPSDSVIIVENIRILKDISPANPVPGSPVRYRITVENYTTDYIQDMVINDTLTNGQEFLTGTHNGFSYTPTVENIDIESSENCDTGIVSVGSNVVTFSNAKISSRRSTSNPGECRITFYAMTDSNASSGDVVKNVLDGVDDVCYGPGSTICAGTGVDTSTEQPATIDANILTLAKSFNPNTNILEGLPSKMTITFSNGSNNTLTNVNLTDNLPTTPANMVVANPAIASSTCGSPTISAVPGSSIVTLTNATVPARANNALGVDGTCVLELNITAPAGIYSNTATVTSATQTHADNNGTTTLSGITAVGTITFGSAIAGSKEFTPSSINSGGKSTVRITLSNKRDDVLTGVNFTDPLPLGMKLASPVNSSTTCAGQSSFSGNPGDSSITFSGAEIAGKGSCDILFDVKATGSSNWVNSIPVGNVTADGNVKNQTAINATLTFAAGSGVSITKSFVPDNLSFPGQVSKLTVNISSGATNLTNLSLTDFFTDDGTNSGALNGMRIAPNSQKSTNCPSGVVSAVDGGTSLSISGVEGSNLSCKFEAIVVSIRTGSITNTIPDDAVVSHQGVSSNGDAANLSNLTEIGVSKNFSPNNIKPNEISKLTVTLINPTVNAATEASVLDTLPIGVMVASNPNGFTNCVGGTFSPAIGATSVSISNVTIPGSSGNSPSSCYFEVDVIASLADDYVNNIPAGGMTAKVGGISQANSIDATDILRVKEPLTTHLAIASKTLDNSNSAGFIKGTINSKAGVAQTMTIYLSNPNTTPLTQVSFDNIFPSGLAIAQTPNASTTCTNGSIIASASGSNVRLTGATIAAGSSCAVTVDVLSNVFGTYTDSIATGDVSSFEGVTNGNSTSASIIVANPPTVSKEFSPAVIAAGGTSTLTIFLGNDNASAITLSSVFTDSLPTIPHNMVVANPPNVIKTCAGTVNPSPGDNSIIYPNGAIIQAGGCSISVKVTAPTAGTYVNIIAANDLQTDAGNNQQASRATLDVSSLGFISGKIFKDSDGDGDFDFGSDSAIKDAEVELRQGSNCSGSLVSNANFSNPIKTGVGGNYLFYGLAVGTYSLCQTSQPTQTSNGNTKAGTINSGGTGTSGAASNQTLTTSQISGIVLNNDGGRINGSENNNFAENGNSLIDLKISKSHSPTNFGESSTTGIFEIKVENLEGGTTSGAITVTDTLPVGMKIAEIIAPSIWTCGGAVGSRNLTCTTNSSIVGMDSLEIIKLRVSVDSGTDGQTLTNEVTVSGGNETGGFTSNNTAFDSVNIVKSTNVSGTVWKDLNGNKVNDDGGSSLMGNWIVELIRGSNVVGTTRTNSSGAYSFTGIAPGNGYNIRFRNPETNMIFGGVVTNENGSSDNPANADTRNKTLDGLDLSISVGGQSLPLDPSGVIYDSTTRQPIKDAIITISYDGSGTFTPATDLTSGVASFTTGSDGFYQFLLNPTAPSGRYILSITNYPSRYNATPSTVIAVCNNEIISAPTPNPAKIQSSSSAPAVGTTLHDNSNCINSTAKLDTTNQATTQYFSTFVINVSTSAEIFNNHIPLDPSNTSSISLTKSSPMVNVHIGQLVPYKIIATNTTNGIFNNLNIKDTIPAGFKYKAGSSTIDGVKNNPDINGRVLTFSGVNLAAKGSSALQMLLVVGSGVQVGKYTNRVQVLDSSNSNAISNVATATVNVVPDPLFDCSEIIGKVFDDTNGSGYPDEGEKGIANVRVVTVNGLLVTTDPHGRFHVACAAIPDSERGSNFIMKLDKRTLPTGYQVSSENPRLVRLTRGKMTKLNFGATIYKTLRIEITEEAFEKDLKNLKNEWLKELKTIPGKFKDAAYKIKAIYYQGDEESLISAKKRLKNVVKTLRKAAKQENINPEINPRIVRSKQKVKDRKILKRKILRYILVETPPPSSMEKIGGAR
ncbi:MAG: putative repeat protein (TIGR01451 family) [Rickettsiales bacterium]